MKLCSIYTVLVLLMEYLCWTRNVWVKVIKIITQRSLPCVQNWPNICWIWLFISNNGCPNGDSFGLEVLHTKSYNCMEVGAFLGFLLNMKSWATLSSLLFVAVHCHSLCESSVLQCGWLGEITFIWYSPPNNSESRSKKRCCDQHVKTVFGSLWADPLSGAGWDYVREELRVKMVC